MRGSVYYQTSLLVKVIFSEGAKKEDRIDSFSLDYKKVASYKTADTYRRIWNNFGLYLKDEFGIKDFEKITTKHIESYMLQKIDIAPSKQYMEKISAALGKLEFALRSINVQFDRVHGVYDFSVRQKLLDEMRREGKVYDGYHNRIYQDPESIIRRLSCPEHRLAAQIQLATGARFEGIGLIKRTQAVKSGIDPVTHKKIFLLETKEKGGKVGMIYLTPSLFRNLTEHLDKHQVFKVNYQQYAKDIRQTCGTLTVSPEGTHGFRWCFAQRRVREYQDHGYSYEEALMGVSMEMKHNRARITEHYIG